MLRGIIASGHVQANQTNKVIIQCHLLWNVKHLMEGKEHQKHHRGAVKKLLSEGQFCESEGITFVVCDFVTPTPSSSGLTYVGCEMKYR